MSRLRRTPSFSTRLIAGAGVALVLLLSVLASSPEAHEWIHGHGGCTANNANASGGVVRLLNALGTSPRARAWINSHSGHTMPGANAGCADNHDPANPDDDGCVVTLFAHGVVTATVFAALVIALFRLVSFTAPPGAALCLPAPHYLLPPLCGPPQS
jgi:hypothetical protein